jgi:two-component system, chemotaxis family, CheB/CheR fusion protein
MHEPGTLAKPDKLDQNLPVIVIGASAGGLTAMNAFFSGAQNLVDCAYLVITHHKSDQRSMLPELLERSSGKRAVEIEDGMKLEKNCIYSNPSGEWFTTIENGAFRLLSPADAAKFAQSGDESGYLSEKVYHPIDFTFQQVAKEIKGRMVGIVLSGSGSDGALGLKTIKAEDGVILVQEPMSAEFTSMPDNAIATGLADDVLPPGDMGWKIDGYLHKSQSMEAEGQRDQGISEEVLRRVCAALAKKTGNDFSCYKPNSMRRRIAKRMALHRFDGAPEYLDFLEHDEHEADNLFRDMLIRVTQFFRDPKVWKYCRKELLPEILRQHEYSDGFRVWVPACSTGDEAYTITILLNELMRESGINKKIQVFASDLDADAIAIARRGEYPSGIISEVPERLLSRYFSYADDHYKIHKSIREQIVFAPHNLIKDPPFTHIDLISCRNLLIYMKPELQVDLISLFHMSLRNNGTLILGPSESVGEGSAAFKALNSKWKVFKRNPDLYVGRASMRHFRRIRGTARRSNLAPPTEQPRMTDENAIAQNVLKLLAKKYAPGALVISERGDILYLHGKAGRFLELGEGQPRYNIFEMGRGEVPTVLPAMIKSATASEGQVVERTINTSSPGEGKAVLAIEKLLAPEPLSGLFLVVFHEEDRSIAASKAKPATKSQRGDPPESEVPELERELEQSRASYQALLEQVETQNAELRTANEEFQSTNEELQSSNEELETSKEETHSLYEELSSINSELVEKVNNLSNANDDMANLLNSTAMAILYLDNELQLKRFTEKAKDIISVRDSDEGRPVSELAMQLENETFIADAEAVLATLQGVEKEVRTQQGDWYLMKLLPYRTRNNVIDGLICTFVEINEVKRSKRSESQFREILSQLPLAFMLVDANGTIFQMSSAMSQALKISGKPSDESRLTDLIASENSSDGVEKSLGEIFDGKRTAVELLVKPVNQKQSGGDATLKLEMRKLSGGSVTPELVWVVCV